jgi:ribonuclease HI
VQLAPQDDIPLAYAVFTDGSVCQHGGAAALQPDTDDSFWAKVEAPRSSTHCELAALCLALGFDTPLVLSDSLTALRMIRSWGTWSTARVLRCHDRAEVRRFMHFAIQRTAAPRLEKVKAHNSEWLQLGHPMAVGNDLADALAKRAASEDGVPLWPQPEEAFRDPLELLDMRGAVVDVPTMFEAAWWRRCRRRRKQPRRWLDELYRDELPIDWKFSAYIFRRPSTSGEAFVHPVAPATIKWVARVRAGCLATRLRLYERHLIASPACQCCDATEEDDEHVVAGCSATGTADWLALVHETWRIAALDTHVSIPAPPTGWLHQHRLQLMAAMIPVSLASLVPLPIALVGQFFRRLHFLLAGEIAERLRRREVLMIEAASSSASTGPAAERRGRSLVRTCALPPERQLTVPDLRRVEVERRAAPPAAPPAPRVPPSGEPRRRWLRRRLVHLLQDDMDVCPAAVGASSEVLLEYFERLTGESFSASPGVSLLSRLNGIGRTMVNVWKQDALNPVLQRHVGAGGRLRWNRQPRGLRVDLAAWRRGVEAAEAFAAPEPRLRGRVAAVNQELLMWVHHHRYLVPAGSDDPVTWESGMALLLLWEVDHHRSFITGGGDSAALKLLSFTRRLKARLALDQEVALWLRWADVAAPLMPGLPPTHHTRWSVRIAAPCRAEPRGWYDLFTERWREYARSLAGPVGAGRALVAPPSMDDGQVGLRRGRTAEGAPRAKRRARGQHPSRGTPASAAPEAADVGLDWPEEPVRGPPSTRTPRPRAAATAGEEPPLKRQRAGDLRRWLLPAPRDVVSSSTSATGAGVSIGHGRATLGPPT